MFGRALMSRFLRELAVISTQIKFIYIVYINYNENILLNKVVIKQISVKISMIDIYCCQ